MGDPTPNDTLVRTVPVLIITLPNGQVVYVYHSPRN
jgi:hypothetical protein